MNPQSFLKRGEVRLAGVTIGGVDRKARSDDYVSPCSQQLQGGLIPDLDPCPGHESVVPRKVRSQLALGVVELAALRAHRVVIAMRLGKGLLAYVAGALLAQFGSIRRASRGRRLEPQGRIDRCTPLSTQTRLLDDLAIVLLLGCTLGAPEGLRHPHQIVAFGLGDEAGECQQFATLLLSQSRQMRAIGLDGF